MPMSPGPVKRVFIVVPLLAGWLGHFNALSSWLANAGWQVNLESPKADRAARDGAEMPAEIDRLRARLHPAVRVRFLPYSWNNGHYAILGFVLAMLRAVVLALYYKHTLFVLWSAVPIVIFGPALRLLNRPTACMVTGLGSSFSDQNRKSWSRRVLTAIYNMVLTGPRSVVIVHNWADRDSLAELTGVAPDRVFVTGGCGVDPVEYPYSATRASAAVPTILVPGRLLREKGILEAAAASGLLSARGIRHRMLFTHSRVKDRAEGLTDEEFDFAASQPDVHFIGYQQSLQELYAQAHVVCSPSWYREGLQTALVEAAASGCPIVVADNVGVRDFIRPEIDGIITPARDAVALADGLERMLAEPDTADRMQRSAHRRFLDGFTKQHMLDTTFDAYGIIGCDPRPSAAASSAHGNPVIQAATRPAARTTA